MDELTSTEFRRRYATLTSPTVVTVNGHVIGTWMPMQTAYPYEPGSLKVHAPGLVTAEPIELPGPPPRGQIVGIPDRLDTQPVRAVPKVTPRVRSPR